MSLIYGLAPGVVGKDIGMADLFECTICKTPFVAEDEVLIAQRNGCCESCTKTEFLKSIGLPPDFLNGFPAP